MNAIIRAIIVDNDTAAVRLLTGLLEQHCPEIAVFAVCSSVAEGIIHIKKNQPDVVFFDLLLPIKKGAESIMHFPTRSFELIVITAQKSYALKAFELNAISFLLKPLTVQLLHKALQKLRQKLQAKAIHTLSNLVQSSTTAPSQGNEFIQITAIQWHTPFCLVYINNQAHKCSLSFPLLVEQLSEFSYLFQVHDQWIINLQQVKSYNISQLTIQLQGNLQIPLAQEQAISFQRIIEKDHI